MSTVVAIILLVGIGGMAISVNEFTLRGIDLAGIVGVVLNLILPKSKTAATQGTVIE